MEQRCWHVCSTVLVIVFFSSITLSHGAPAFKIKHLNFLKKNELSPARVERRLIGGSSPIHFIHPLVPLPEHPVQAFHDFFSANAAKKPNFYNVAASSPKKSNIYKLPLRLQANGKMQNVIYGFPKKRNYFVDQMSLPSSNVIQLPLKYTSNAKPYGVYFPKPSLNFL